MQPPALPPLPELPDASDTGSEAVLVSESYPVRPSMLDEDLKSLRTLVGVLFFISILIISSIMVVSVRKWLHDEVIGGASTELTARAAKYDSLVQFDRVGQFSGDGVVVCIVDSGIDLTHPDLDHITLRGWRDFISNGSQPYDDHGHGTAMAGILMADGSLHGKATGVGLLVAKALSKEGTGTDQGVSDAIDWCVSEGAEVVSLSLGGASGIIPSEFQGDGAAASAREAVAQGVFVIAAAGNDGQDSDDEDVDSPGSEEEVICVGGVNEHGAPWVGTSKGDDGWGLRIPPIRQDPNKKPELVAPAERVPVLGLNGAWGLADGTSAATVYVTGAIALLLEGRPDMQRNGSAGGEQSVEQVKEWIQETVKPRDGQQGHDEYYGYGLLQVEKLLERAGAQMPQAASE